MAAKPAWKGVAMSDLNHAESPLETGNPQVAAPEIDELKVKPATPGATAMGEEDLLSLIQLARKRPEEVATLLKTKKEFVTVPIAKTPPKGLYYRVREGDDWHYTVQTYMMLPPDFGVGRKDYLLVNPILNDFVAAKGQIRSAVKPLGLAFVVNVNGEPSFWALNLGDSGPWGASARVIAEKLKTQWGMVCTGPSSYVLELPEGDLGEPSWPEGSPNDWLMKAFRGRIIDSEDHPEFNRLLGKL